VATKFLAAAVVALAAVVLVPGAAAGDLTAHGAATPASVLAGDSTLLTVAVTPLSGQPSEDIGVVCNLKPIGGGMTLLHDDGTNGDEISGDLTFSELVAIPADATPGTLDFFCVANDGAGGAAELDIFVTVIPERPVNQAPTINAGGPYTVDEGGSVSLAAAGSDPENAPLTYAWDLDNNGTFETAGQNVSFTADDGPETATVHVQVTDNGGLTAVADATVTIKNVPPSATSGAPTSADAGIPFMLSLSSPSDPSTADTDAGFTYAFDCGDGYGSFGPDSSRQCPATDVGTLSVGAEIQDRNGGITEYRASVAVTVTFDGLCDLVHAYSTDSKLAANLCSKLDEAARAPTESAKAGALGAFQNMVEAKVGKGLTAEQAAELTLLSTQL
jgi:hypothetical protein